VTGDIVRTDALHDEFNSHNFSSGDLKLYSDLSISFPGFKGYLGTPSGLFKVFDPASGSVTVLR